MSQALCDKLSKRNKTMNSQSYRMQWENTELFFIKSCQVKNNKEKTVGLQSKEVWNFEN